MSTGTSTRYGYRIEIRDTSFCPRNPAGVNDGVIGPEWREFTPEVTLDPSHVPAGGLWGHGLSDHNLLAHEGALALAWTLIAQQPTRMGIEARLVRYRVQASYSVDRQGVVKMPPIQLNHFAKIELEPEPEPVQEEAQNA